MYAGARPWRTKPRPSMSRQCLCIITTQQDAFRTTSFGHTLSIHVAVKEVSGPSTIGAGAVPSPTTLSPPSTRQMMKMLCAWEAGKVSPVWGQVTTPLLEMTSLTALRE